MVKIEKKIRNYKENQVNERSLNLIFLKTRWAVCKMKTKKNMQKMRNESEK